MPRFELTNQLYLLCIKIIFSTDFCDGLCVKEQIKSFLKTIFGRENKTLHFPDQSRL